MRTDDQRPQAWRSNCLGTSWVRGEKSAGIAHACGGEGAGKEDFLSVCFTWVKEFLEDERESLAQYP